MLAAQSSPGFPSSRFAHPLDPSPSSSSSGQQQSLLLDPSYHQQHIQPSPLSYHPAPTNPVPPPRFASRTNVNTSSAADAGLVKKASKPILGWFVRKLRRTSGPGGDPAAAGTSSFKVVSAVGPVGGTVRGRKGGKATWIAEGGGDGSAYSASDPATFDAPTVDLREPSGASDYGRLVASNGVALMTGRPSRASAIEEGDDEQDSRSIATSLEPFPPSQHARTTTATIGSRASTSNYSTSFYHHSHQSSSSSSANSIQSSFAPSADENASLRPLPPSNPPSPTPSYPSLSVSTANSAGGWGRSSAGGGTTTRTSPMTSIDSRGTGGTGFGPAIVFAGPPAHIATVPAPPLPPTLAVAGPSNQVHPPSSPHHQRGRSWTSDRLATLLPPAPSPTGGHGSASHRRSLVHRDSGHSVSSMPTSPLLTQAHAHAYTHAHSPAVLPGIGRHQSHLSTSSAPTTPLHTTTTSTPLSISFSPNSPPPQTSASPPTLIPLLPLGSSASQPPTSPSSLSHTHAPTHSHPHPRNNPLPSAPPPDNASLLTLASSSFFSFANTTGGGGGGTGSIAPASIRRGAESVSFSLNAPSIYNGGGPSIINVGGGGRRRSFDTSNPADGRSVHGTMLPPDDAQASVRAVRRRGSCESAESRWSAANVPGSGMRSGGGERDSLWGGGAGSFLGSKRVRSMMSGNEGGSRRSSLEMEDGDEDDEDEDDDGGGRTPGLGTGALVAEEDESPFAAAAEDGGSEHGEDEQGSTGSRGRRRMSDAGVLAVETVRA